jgi:predicted deacetylase
VRLIVAIHDITPARLAHAEALREMVAREAPGPASLLVIPRYAGTASWRAGAGAARLGALSRAGDEIVVHGYSHVTRRGRDGPETARMSPACVGATVRAGADELRSVGLVGAGFIAPAYGRAAGCGGACRAAGLGWWAGRLALHHPGGAMRLPSLGLGASAPVRRALSPLCAAAAAAALRRAPVVRLDLHTADLGHPRLAVAARSLLCGLLGQGRSLTTHAALLSVGEESRCGLRTPRFAPMQGV